MEISSICVFCGSSSGESEIYAEKTIELGRYLASENIRLIYGGGSAGLMGKLANAVMQSGGKVTGIIPELIKNKIKSPNLTQTIVTADMHERKKIMYDKSDAFIALPGGIGTLEELSEVFTWQQLGYHTKAVSIYNINGFFNDLVSFLTHSVAEGFLKQIHLDRLIVEEQPEQLLNRIRNFKETTVDKWI